MKVADDFDAPLPTGVAGRVPGSGKEPKRGKRLNAGWIRVCFFGPLLIPGKLNRRARDLLSNEREGLFLSAASPWEISLKFGLGKLELPEPPAKYVPKWMLNWGIRGLDISHLHALAVGDLPLHHQDPFDRILIVQARDGRHGVADCGSNV